MSRKEVERCPRNPSGGFAPMVLCPTTGKEFSIGIDVDRFSLAGGKGVVTTAICPHCEGEHAWRLDEVRYSEINNTVISGI
jgi:hypothetical protein